MPLHDNEGYVTRIIILITPLSTPHAATTASLTAGNTSSLQSQHTLIWDEEEQSEGPPTPVALQLLCFYDNQTLNLVPSLDLCFLFFIIPPPHLFKCVDVPYDQKHRNRISYVRFILSFIFRSERRGGGACSQCHFLFPL